MINRYTRRRVSSLLGVVAVASVFLVAQSSGATGTGKSFWIGTWSTAISEPGCWPRGFGNPPDCAPTSNLAFDDQSLRMVVRVSAGGDRVRIRLSNAFGRQAVTVGRATVALPVVPASPDIRQETLRVLTFSGAESATMLKGADVLSDPVSMSLPAGADLTVSFYLPTATGPAPFHLTARQRVYVYAGDRTREASGAGSTAVHRSSFFLAGVDVSTSRVAGSVVVVGDSISDGNGNTVDAHRRWPDLIAARMRATPSTSDDRGVLNQSLAGNRLTRHGADAPLGFTVLGLNGLARLDSDVFGQTGVRTVVLQLGVNDILFGADPAQRIVAGIRQFAAQVRAKGMRVVVCTLPPVEGFAEPPWTPEKEAIRQAVNTYLRGSTEFTGLIDIDAVLRDPARPARLRAEYDSGDHLNINDAGAQALADAVSLSLL